MSNASRSVQVEVKLGRDEYRDLMARLRSSPVSLQIRRGRFTADSTWMELEIRGNGPDVDQALRLTRSSS